MTKARPGTMTQAVLRNRMLVSVKIAAVMAADRGAAAPSTHNRNTRATPASAACTGGRRKTRIKAITTAMGDI